MDKRRYIVGLAVLMGYAFSLSLASAPEPGSQVEENNLAEVGETLEMEDLGVSLVAGVGIAAALFWANRRKAAVPPATHLPEVAQQESWMSSSPPRAARAEQVPSPSPSPSPSLPPQRASFSGVPEHGSRLGQPSSPRVSAWRQGCVQAQEEHQRQREEISRKENRRLNFVLDDRDRWSLPPEEYVRRSRAREAQGHQAAKEVFERTMGALERRRPEGVTPRSGAPFPQETQLREGVPTRSPAKRASDACPPKGGVSAPSRPGKGTGQAPRPEGVTPSSRPSVQEIQADYARELAKLNSRLKRDIQVREAACRDRLVSMHSGCSYEFTKEEWRQARQGHEERRDRGIATLRRACARQKASLEAAYEEKLRAAGQGG